MGSNPVASTKTAVSPLVVRLFLILRLATGFEGRDEQTHKLRVCGDRAQRKPHFAREKPFCGSKTLCLTKLGLWKTWRQRTTLITSERGAPLKARIPDAHSSLFRRYAPYCLDQKMQEIASIFVHRDKKWTLHKSRYGSDGLKKKVSTKNSVLTFFVCWKLIVSLCKQLYAVFLPPQNNLS